MLKSLSICFISFPPTIQIASIPTIRASNGSRSKYAGSNGSDGGDGWCGKMLGNAATCGEKRNFAIFRLHLSKDVEWNDVDKLRELKIQFAIFPIFPSLSFEQNKICSCRPLEFNTRLLEVCNSIGSKVKKRETRSIFQFHKFDAI